MTTPLSIRFAPSLLARLRQRANAMTGASVAGLAQRLIDEGLRMADHPGVTFKDGPSGRRATLAYGPDVWEVKPGHPAAGCCSSAAGPSPGPGGTPAR